MRTVHAKHLIAVSVRLQLGFGAALVSKLARQGLRGCLVELKAST